VNRLTRQCTRSHSLSRPKLLDGNTDTASKTARFPTVRARAYPSLKYSNVSAFEINFEGWFSFFSYDTDSRWWTDVSWLSVILLFTILFDQWTMRPYV
jgi:hypothetical protein